MNRLQIEQCGKALWRDYAQQIKVGYKWLLQERGGSNHTLVWSKIWKLKCPKKIKFLIWSEWHNSTPTLQTLRHRGITQPNSCPRCGICEETFSHAIRDCLVSMEMWKGMGFRDHTCYDSNQFCKVSIKHWTQNIERKRWTLALDVDLIKNSSRE